MSPRAPEIPTALRRVAGWSWPQGFPLVQFPNPPLILALAASVARGQTSGGAERVASAIFYVGLSIWAYEELRRGDNWFRRLLGAGFSVYIVVRLSRSLDG
jgi:hypothetical protein